MALPKTQSEQKQLLFCSYRGGGVSCKASDDRFGAVQLWIQIQLRLGLVEFLLGDPQIFSALFYSAADLDLD